MPIVLLTDFGSKDPYVGILKGVIAQIAPQVPIIDLCHEIPSFDIEAAAFSLKQSYAYFPEGTVFLTVVDPGVGSECRRLLVKTANYFFVGPDNGYLSLVLDEEKIEHIIHLDHDAYFLHHVSSTFHGRDVFAPVAAQLAEGMNFREMGTEVYELKRLENLPPKHSKNKIEGKILSIDHFGNAITNISQTFIQRHWGKEEFALHIKDKKIILRFDHYAQADLNKVFMIYGSSGFLEISMKQASAVKKMKLKKGDRLNLKKN